VSEPGTKPPWRVWLVLQRAALAHRHQPVRHLGWLHAAVWRDRPQGPTRQRPASHVRGVRISEPLVGIDVSDPQAIQTGQLERLLLPLNRRLAADITLPIRTLDIDPALLYAALRFYHQHP
jgi:hypothetical protein